MKQILIFTKGPFVKLNSQPNLNNRSFVTYEICYKKEELI